MKLNRLLNTAAIRLALRYALYYVLITSSGLGALYWSHSQFVDAQITAGLDYELSTLEAIDQNKGRDRLLQVINNRIDIGTENRHYLLLVDAEGNKLAGDLHHWPSLLPTDQKVRNIWIHDETHLHHPMLRYDYWPMIATRLSDGSKLLVAQGVKQAVALQEFLLLAMGLLLLAVVCMTLLLGWRMGRQMLERVDTINTTARQILTGDLSSRIVTSYRNDEFDELAEQLNSMLNHLERLINGMREMTDNIAHDMRHPLTRLHNRLEVSLLNARNEAEYRETLEHALNETQGMIRTFNALLEIAQAEAGSCRGEKTEINISLLVKEISELYQGGAEENVQTLQTDIQPNVYIEGNRHLLALALSNLLENAIKYSGKASVITLQVAQPEHHQAQIVVSDTGPGVPESEYQHIMQRFVRLDKNRSTPGNGLGLSLVAAACDFHHATISLHDNQPGLRVEITFMKRQPRGEET